MNQDPTSLDHLHDLAEPPPVAWWPLAPGWNVLIAIAAIVLLGVLFLQWKKWRSNAYRREALHELQMARTAVDIAVILKRTALSFMPRTSIAGLREADWVEWLERSSSGNVSPEIRSTLTTGIYREGSQSVDIADLREFAADWIRHHRRREQTV